MDHTETRDGNLYKIFPSILPYEFCFSFLAPNSGSACIIAQVLFIHYIVTNLRRKSHAIMSAKMERKMSKR